MRPVPDHLIALYWFVRPNDDEGEANMKIMHIGGLPCLVNSRKVDAGTALRRNQFPHALEKERLDTQKEKDTLKQDTSAPSKGKGKREASAEAKGGSGKVKRAST